MSSTTPSKTAGSTAISWTNGDLASAAQYKSSAIDVSAKFAIAFNIQIARRTGTAFTAGYPKVRIEASGKSSGDDTWIPLAEFVPTVGASIANTTANGAIAANDATFVVAAATNMAIGDYLFLGHTTDPTKYELIRVKSLSGTTITPEHNVVNAHDTGAMITDQAEAYFPVFDCSAYTRMRAVADNANSGQAAAFQVLYNLLDSLTTA